MLQQSFLLLILILTPLLSAVALADAWAAPILTTGSGARAIETVVLTRERGTPSLSESLSILVRRLVGHTALDKQTTQFMDSQSRNELQAELRRLEQERRANTSSGGTLCASWSGKGSSLVKGNPSLVRTTPSKSWLANKAYQLMVLAAILVSLETLYRSYHPEPRVSATYSNLCVCFVSNQPSRLTFAQLFFNLSLQCFFRAPAVSKAPRGWGRGQGDMKDQGMVFVCCPL